jgi:tetratricopeptide (TPR) repeat protein
MYCPRKMRSLWTSMRFSIFTILALAALCILPAAGQYPPDYWSSEAYQALNNGSYDKAAASYDRALELNPTNASLLIGRGLALFNLGKYNESVASLDLALAANPSNADAFYFKGLVLSSGLERYDDAIQSFDKALQINSTYYDALMNKGVALGNLGRFDEALVSFDSALRINPQDPKLWNNKGVVLLQQKNYPAALTCFNKALELDPDYGVALANKESALKGFNQDNFYELDEMLYLARQREGSSMI